MADARARAKVATASRGVLAARCPTAPTRVRASQELRAELQDAISKKRAVNARLVKEPGASARAMLRSRFEGFTVFVRRCEAVVSSSPPCSTDGH